MLNVKTEDQLFDILINRNKPVLVLYFFPGQPNSLDMAMYQGEFIEKYGNDYVEMAKVNCRFNMDLCTKKGTFIKFPQYELMYPPIVLFIDKVTHYYRKNLMRKEE